ncbi:hypothetical protein GCK72_008759 [Caenorhabditis remanei]|uniref:Uncharacterized protein n=1 Tax=Caenorhabditis remanei TaxID=31234 RepID=A0A6A5GYE1_CAERE|nr:hypothetical protein GCK72_008759 [Caenorhabditis remanei]KAF1760510.1 hypothetical protein GCK72_008759 [Caenorhabditis remanei]
MKKHTNQKELATGEETEAGAEARTETGAVMDGGEETGAGAEARTETGAVMDGGESEVDIESWYADHDHGSKLALVTVFNNRWNYEVIQQLDEVRIDLPPLNFEIPNELRGLVDITIDTLEMIVGDAEGVEDWRIQTILRDLLAALGVHCVLIDSVWWDRSNMEDQPSLLGRTLPNIC